MVNTEPTAAAGDELVVMDIDSATYLFREGIRSGYMTGLIQNGYSFAKAGAEAQAFAAEIRDDAVVRETVVAILKKGTVPPARVLKTGATE